MTVEIELIPESAIPLPDDNFVFGPELEEVVTAAIHTLQLHELAGMEVPPPEEEQREAAREIFVQGSGTVSKLEFQTTMHLRALLQEYDFQVIRDATQLRTYVLNRLLLESDNANANVRIKALDMLGRVSDVGLFTDKTEVTHKHAPTPELEARLRQKLEQLIRKNTTPADVQDVEPTMKHP